MVSQSMRLSFALATFCSLGVCETACGQFFSRGGSPGNIAFTMTGGIPEYSIPQNAFPSTSGYAVQQQAYAVRQMMAARQYAIQSQNQRQIAQVQANYQRDLIAQRKERAEKTRQRRAERAAANRAQRERARRESASGLVKPDASEQRPLLDSVENAAKNSTSR